MRAVDVVRNLEGYVADVIVPCYNEGNVLPSTVPRIVAHFRNLVADTSKRLSGFRLLLVDDGSRDETWHLISAYAAEHSELQGIKLARNFGHQAALLSGLSLATADVVISMDADLQDDIQAVDAMLAAYESGADLALGIRNDRATDSPFKRSSANIYYRLLSFLGVNVIENHGDYRLMSKPALAALLLHEEVNLYLRGLIPTLGFPVTLVPYTRQFRAAGHSKYTLRKMIGLAVDGVTSFTTVPVRFIAFMGGIVFTGSMLLGAYYLAARLIAPENTVPGWASTLLPLLFLGGFQILSIGILGEYVGKIYMEVKRRPRFIIEKKTDRIC